LEGCIPDGLDTNILLLHRLPLTVVDCMLFVGEISIDRILIINRPTEKTLPYSGFELALSLELSSRRCSQLSRSGWFQLCYFFPAKIMSIFNSKLFSRNQNFLEILQFKV